MKALVPKIVHSRIELGGSVWLGEFRTVTIVKVALLELNFDRQFLPRVHQCVREAQAVSQRLEGGLDQVVMDDKGLSMTLVFGLPPFGHEEDPLRAVQAALEIKRRLIGLGVRTSIGLATGRVFCGDYGGQSRRSYGVLGPAMNLAAQIMDAIDGDIACDAVTAQAVSQRMSFTVLPALRLKGAATPTLAFRPIAMTEMGHRHATDFMVGREAERASLRACLDELAQGRGKFVQVLGEAGIGKSRLLSEFVAMAEAAGQPVLQSFATAIDRSTPYFVWRGILRQALAIEGEADTAANRARISNLLADNPTHASWLPLLEAVVPVGFAETQLTEQIAGSARAGGIEELVIALLSKCTSRALVIVFEDRHWFDGSSLSLLRAVVRRLPHFLVAVSGRPDARNDGIEPEQHELKPDLEIELKGLARDAATEIIRRRLNAIDVPASLVDFVYRRSDGNPFYCEELVMALRDTGSIEVAQGVCRFDQARASSSSIAQSAELERAIVSRIDVLPEDDQVVLKVASTIGDVFSVSMVAQAFGDLVRPDGVQAAVDRLVKHDFLFPPHGPSGAYAFRHTISREVTYNLLSFAQRRTLHRQIATFLERDHADRLEPIHALLARHWEASDEPARAVDYLELAARQALLNYANRATIDHLLDAAAIVERTGVVIADDRRAGWEIMCGDAYHELFDHESSERHYARALALLGRELPATTAKRALALTVNGLVQLKSRLWRPSREASDPAQRKALQQAAHIYEHLAEQYFFKNDSLAVLNGTLASLNLAESGGAVAETVRGYAALGLGLGMSGAVAAARRYGRRALDLAHSNGGLPEIARVQLVVGVLEYGLGAWDKAERGAEEAIALYRRLGDRTRRQNSETMAIFVCVLRGDIEEADRRLSQLGAEIDPNVPAQVRSWHLSARILIDTVRGNTNPDDLAELVALAETRLQRTDRLLCLGLAAAAYLQRRDLAKALPLAERGLDVLAECNVVWGGFACGAAGVADALLQGWEDEIASRAGASKTSRTCAHRLPAAVAGGAHFAGLSPLRPLDARPGILSVGPAGGGAPRLGARQPRGREHADAPRTGARAVRDRQVLRRRRPSGVLLSASVGRNLRYAGRRRRPRAGAASPLCLVERVIP